MYPGMTGGSPAGQYAQSSGGYGNNNSSRVDELLRSLSCYYPQNKPRISYDVQRLVGRCATLRPETDIHTSNEGVTETLLKLQGTIPIRYQNQTYNIPMAFWIPSAYPMQGPLVYVVPTNTMEIAHNHEYVAPDGTVYLPYLNQWNVNRSNLVDLLDTCSAIFSQIPPVRSKPASRQRPTSVQMNKPPPAYSQHPRPSSQSFTPPPPPYPSYPGQQMSPLDNRKKEEKQIRDAMKIKLSRHVQKFYQEIRVEVDKEFEMQRSLQKGNRQLKEIKESLEKQKKDLTEISAEISEKHVQVTSWLEHNEDTAKADVNDEELNIDSAVSPSDKWSLQLFDAVAEMHAIEDTLFMLDKALANDVIDINLFLKEVRKLSRKQFLVKALAIKIMKKQQVQTR